MRLPVGIRRAWLAVPRSAECVASGHASPLVFQRKDTMRTAIRGAQRGSEGDAVAAGRMIGAVVVHGATATPYWRAGNGSALLMLLYDGALAVTFLRALADHFRVIAPELPPHRATARIQEQARPEAAIWLTGFVDGLGLRRFSVLADCCWWVGLGGLALREPGRIDRVVLLLTGACDRLASESAIPGGPSVGTPPSLLVRIDGTRDPLLLPEIITSVRSFLVEEPGPTAR
jgi:pimeloyl-ACP methyl ester carboxylesterase